MKILTLALAAITLAACGGAPFSASELAALPGGAGSGAGAPSAPSAMGQAGASSAGSSAAAEGGAPDLPQGGAGGAGTAGAAPSGGAAGSAGAPGGASGGASSPPSPIACKAPWWAYGDVYSPGDIRLDVCDVSAPASTAYLCTFGKTAAFSCSGQASKCSAAQPGSEIAGGVWKFEVYCPQPNGS